MDEPRKPLTKTKRNNLQNAKRNISINKDITEQLNKQIEKHAKDAYGIELHAQSHGKVSKQTQAELNIRRNNEVLQSLYNLIESQILPIALIGIQKAKEGDISMIKYWCDKYVPPEVLNKSWDKGDKGSNVNFLQQVIQFKMQLDTSGKSLEEVIEASKSLVDTTSTATDKEPTE